MTTCAALFGTLPIALGSGAGSELRQPLGIAVCGGLIVSQLLTLFITPVVYIYLDKIETLLNRRRHAETVAEAAILPGGATAPQGAALQKPD
jgi:HAE1 family hydrophobic/amphiphilic exporter-1